MMNKIGTFIRIFLRDRVSLLLGIGSLSIGIAVSLIIGLWYVNETHYDNFHPDPDNTYRICRKVFMGDKDMVVGSDFNPVGKNVAKVIPEVQAAVRVRPSLDAEGLGERVKYANKNYFINNLLIVDTTFFDFFAYELVAGSKQAFRSKPNAIIIDEQTAHAIFGKEEPLGKILSIYGDREVVGVLKNQPSNTHLTCHALVPIHSVEHVDNAKWGGNDSFMIYVKLSKGAQPAAVSKKLKAYSEAEFEAYKTYEMSYILQPLTSIHLSTGMWGDAKFGVRVANPTLLSTFLVIGVVILLIALVNFVNLFISSAFLRAKAIGLKKMNGASRLHIVAEFVSETILYIAAALFVALLLAFSVLPYFSQFIGYTLVLPVTDIVFWISVLSACLIISLFAGTVPGLYMSGFKTLETLKGRFKGQRIIVLQKGLLIMQFTASIALLMGVFFINKQIRFMNETDLGFDKEQLIYINIPKGYVDKILSLQEEIEKSPYVQASSLSNGTCLQWWQGNPISIPNKPEEQVLAELKKIQHNYFDVYGMEIIEGENTLYAALGQDGGQECLINEKAARSLHLEPPYVGQSINLYSYDHPLRIAGVVKDAYTKALSTEIDPQVYVRLSRVWPKMSLMIKTTGKGMQDVVAMLKAQWEANADVSVYPFSYHFLDKDYEALYKSEEQAGALALWTMGIALFLTVGGLWGMARYSSHRRTKEIGVRKVNGATILEVLKLLNMEFVKWVVVSFAVATPIAWYLLQKWLQDFALQTDLSWWVFALAGILALLVAVATVTWQSWRSASRNPVDALRYE